MNTVSIPQSIPLSVHITSSFIIPTENLQALDKYYVLYWQARYLYTQLLRSPRIVRERVAYVPVLQDITTTELCKNPGATVRLSFRRLRGHTSGYVIIRPSCIVRNTPAKKVIV